MDGEQLQQPCSCTATANLALMRKEMERYKAMYEREREQFEEFQRYSKELESEMDLELKQRDRKLTELEAARRRLNTELDSIKTRAEQQRREQHQTEEQLKSRLSTTEHSCQDLRQKLRAVEQANDDMERRERIHAQQLLDLSERYDKCLERCALLETGLAGPNSPATAAANSSSYSLLMANGTTPNSSSFADQSSGSSLMLHLPPTPTSIRETASQLAAGHESNHLIDNMLRKIEAVESQMLVNGHAHSSASPSQSQGSSSTMLANGHRQNGTQS